MHRGSCLCEAVAFNVVGDFEGFFLCHCSRCRKVTGSAHASNLFSNTAKLEWIKGQDRVRTFRLSGTRFGKSFCESCGSALPIVQDSGRLLVPAGSLDSAVGMTPNAHIFVGSRADWDRDLHSLTTFDGLPTGR